jgi:hypothetical protein
MYLFVFYRLHFLFYFIQMMGSLNLMGYKESLFVFN